MSYLGLVLRLSQQTDDNYGEGGDHQGHLAEVCVVDLRYNSRPVVWFTTARHRVDKV